MVYNEEFSKHDELLGMCSLITKHNMLHGWEASWEQLLP